MSTYDKIAWLPLCGGLTGLGLVLSYLWGRKRGIRSMLRGAAWSLLPLAAYLTGAIEMFWKIGVAIGDFGSSFVISARVWSGIAVFGVAVVLFVATGGIRRRGRGKAVKQADKPADGTGLAGGSSLPGLTGSQPTTAITKAQPAEPAAGQAQRVPAKRGKAAKKGKGGDGDHEMKEIDEILRRHGIS